MKVFTSNLQLKNKSIPIQWMAFIQIDLLKMKRHKKLFVLNFSSAVLGMNQTVECIISPTKNIFSPTIPQQNWVLNLCMTRFICTIECYYTTYTTRYRSKRWKFVENKMKKKKSLSQKRFFYPGAQTNFIISTVI